MGTSVARSTAVQELYQRGEAFGIPGNQADGMDVVAVQSAAEASVAKCRAGDGPALLEMMTYRYRGHSMSDPAKYRTREEVSKMRQERDPIENVREQMIAEGFADDDALKEVDRDVKAKINDAAEFAQDNPQPDSTELHTDILATA